MSKIPNVDPVVNPRRGDRALAVVAKTRPLAVCICGRPPRTFPPPPWFRLREPQEPRALPVLLP